MEKVTRLRVTKSPELIATRPTLTMGTLPGPPLLQANEHRITEKQTLSQPLEQEIREISHTQYSEYRLNRVPELCLFYCFE